MKSLAFIHRNDAYFAVESFYPVVSVFSHYDLGNTISPFLLLDHIGPGRLKPDQVRQGVQQHPHRGFETVTLVFQGEIEHWDSQGHGGVIGPGDVQWMTAASGILHKEQFSEAFTRQGGPFEVLQLWVNLPARDKMQAPRYQSLSNAAIPCFDFPDRAGRARVIAGEFLGITGPALTHSPITLVDLHLAAGQTLQLPAQHLDTTLLYMRRGKAQFSAAASADEILTDQGLAVMSSHGEHLQIQTLSDCEVLLMSGTPLNEPLFGRGFYVMNTQEEVREAIEDMKKGTFLKLAPEDHN